MSLLIMLFNGKRHPFDSPIPKSHKELMFLQITISSFIISNEFHIFEIYF